MTSRRDCYGVLGIRRNATAQEIRGAFRRMSMAYHPDHNKNPDAAERMREINEAYQTLSDPEKRAAHDRELDRAGARRAQPPHTPRANPPHARRGPDVRIVVNLTWEEARYGTELELFINGRRLAVDIPSGIDDGTTLRLNGQGEPGANGGGPGDALLSVRVDYPESAPEPERKRSDSKGCGCGTAFAVGFVIVILIWIASGC